MSLGVRLRSSSELFSVSCDGLIVDPRDYILPPAVVDLLAPGGWVVGWIHLTDSIKSPGSWVVVNPYTAGGIRLPQEIVELGSSRAIKAFNNLLIACESYVPDLR